MFLDSYIRAVLNGGMIAVVKDRRTLRLRNALEEVEIDIATMEPRWRREMVQRYIQDVLRRDAEVTPES